jgi:alpha-amylase
MIRHIYNLSLMLLLIFFSCSSSKPTNIENDPNNEIIYHVMQRSFYDSNGDGHGDLDGLREKLDYLQELGVTSVLLLPLYESAFYHNYFAGDFGKIDPEFGTEADWLDLVKETHRRKMKIYMDMETQYVTEDQLWFKDSYKNPSSPYSEYVFYNGAGNTDPENIIFNLTEMPGYDGTKKKVTTVNMNSKKVWGYNYQLFKHWVDPNQDGKFDDGVDGFRLDHMMDDLDFKGKFTNLFQKFWKPLVDSLKKINPDLNFVAEQADWNSFGREYFESAGVDRVFAFRLAAAIRALDKKQIESLADSTFLQTPRGKQQVVMISNHDFDRVNEDNAGRSKVMAALNLLIGGVPCIYYGQEIGMRGKKGEGQWGFTDANDIPLREAFEWYANDEGKGMTSWYKDSGPWKDRNGKPGDGISLEEEKKDPNSLWNFYRQVIELRRKNPPFISGQYQTLNNNNDRVLSFFRHEKEKTGLVIVNLSGDSQQVTVSLTNSKLSFDRKDMQALLGNEPAKISASGLTIQLRPYSTRVWKIN